MRDIADKLVTISKRMEVGFMLKGRLLTADEVFADTGMLPGLTKRADQLSSLCFGYGLGATYEDVEKSLMGSRVIFDDFTPDILRILCIVDVLYELKKGSLNQKEITLDELMYD